MRGGGLGRDTAREGRTRGENYKNKGTIERDGGYGGGGGGSRGKEMATMEDGGWTEMGRK